MAKRQEKPYAAQIAAMTKPKFTAEIGRIIALSIAETEDTEERLRECIAEDVKRGGGFYEKAIAQINQSMGYRVTGVNTLDAGNIAL